MEVKDLSCLSSNKIVYCTVRSAITATAGLVVMHVTHEWVCVIVSCVKVVVMEVKDLSCLSSNKIVYCTVGPAIRATAELPLMYVTHECVTVLCRVWRW